MHVADEDGQWRSMTGVTNATVNSGMFAPEYWANDIVTYMRQNTVTFDAVFAAPAPRARRWKRLRRTWRRFRFACDSFLAEWRDCA